MELIEKFRKLLNSFSNKKWQIIAGEMLAETPNYPFVEMFVINLTPDFHNQSIEVVKKESGMLTEQNIKTYNSTLQFNFRHKTMMEAVELANNLFRIINFEKRNMINNNGFGIKRMSFIRNLNFIEAGKWSYCYSFDVEISFDVIEEREVETIETVKTKINNKQEVTINE